MSKDKTLRQHVVSTYAFILSTSNSSLLRQLDKEILNSNLGLFFLFFYFCTQLESKRLEAIHQEKKKRLEACDLNLEQLHELQTLLGHFEEIFVLPYKLPPSRSHDHYIPLILGSKPPNIRPCHYGSARIARFGVHQT